MNIPPDWFGGGCPNPLLFVVVVAVNAEVLTFEPKPNGWLLLLLERVLLVPKDVWPKLGTCAPKTDAFDCGAPKLPPAAAAAAAAPKVFDAPKDGVVVVEPPKTLPAVVTFVPPKADGVVKELVVVFVAKLFAFPKPPTALPLLLLLLLLVLPNVGAVPLVKLVVPNNGFVFVVNRFVLVCAGGCAWNIFVAVPKLGAAVVFDVKILPGVLFEPNTIEGVVVVADVVVVITPPNTDPKELVTGGVLKVVLLLLVVIVNEAFVAPNAGGGGWFCPKLLWPPKTDVVDDVFGGVLNEFDLFWPNVNELLGLPNANIFDEVVVVVVDDVACTVVFGNENVGFNVPKAGGAVVVVDDTIPKDGAVVLAILEVVKEDVVLVIFPNAGVALLKVFVKVNDGVVAVVVVVEVLLIPKVDVEDVTELPKDGTVVTAGVATPKLGGATLFPNDGVDEVTVPNDAVEDVTGPKLNVGFDTVAKDVVVLPKVGVEVTVMPKLGVVFVLLPKVDAAVVCVLNNELFCVWLVIVGVFPPNLKLPLRLLGVENEFAALEVVVVVAVVAPKLGVVPNLRGDGVNVGIEDFCS